MIASEKSVQPPRPGTVPHGAVPHGTTAGLAQCAMPATPESTRALRHFARAVARRWRLRDECDEALSVIVTELVGNVVLHSGSSWVALAIKRHGDVLTAEVRDGGHWKHRAGPRREPLDAHAECGRGLRLVDAFASRTVTRREPVGSVVAAEFLLAPDAPGPAAGRPASAAPPARETGLAHGIGRQPAGPGDHRRTVPVSPPAPPRDVPSPAPGTWSR
ncbi:ATP-binding protein [Streptomyces sp. CAU 1734]|uniref:ATP-binding protein n=1 Tax=Streptomyces sp. CAU 1734 TaxID=3140360 RepID=UPI003260D377